MSCNQGTAFTWTSTEWKYKIIWDVNQKAKLQTGTNYTVSHDKVVGGWGTQACRLERAEAGGAAQVFHRSWKRFEIECLFMKPQKIKTVAHRGIVSQDMIQITNRTMAMSCNQGTAFTWTSTEWKYKIIWDVNQKAKLQTGTNYTVSHDKVVGGWGTQPCRLEQPGVHWAAHVVHRSWKSTKQPNSAFISTVERTSSREEPYPHFHRLCKSKLFQGQVLSAYMDIYRLPNKTKDKITWDVNQRAKLQTGTNYTVPHAKVVADETLRHADWSVRKYMELRRCSTVPGKVLKLRAYFWNHSKSKQVQTEVLSHKNWFGSQTKLWPCHVIKARHLHGHLPNENIK